MAVFKENKIISATKWSVVCEGISKIIAPITTMILARILAAEVFGIVASITAITSFADLMTDAGFNSYIVQHQFAKEEKKKHTYNVCFWSNLTISIVLFVLIMLNRWTLAKLIGVSGYETALVVASFVLPLTSISSIEQAIMRRELQFKKVGFIKVIAKLMPLVTTIPLALVGLEYWSLIIGTLLGEMVNVLLCLKYGGFIPAIYFSFSCLKNIFSFSLWAFLESILEWLISNVAILLLGNIFGIYCLGIFKTGINVISQIMTSVYALYANVYKSAISREQNNQTNFSNIFCNFQKITSIISSPMGVGVFLYRDLITFVFLGEKWLEASVLIGLYGMSSMFSIAFGNFYSDAIRAKGYPKKLVFIDAIYLFVICLLLMNATSLGFQKFCVFFAICKVIQPILQIIIGQKYSGVKFGRVLVQCWPQLLATAIMGITIKIGKFNLYSYGVQMITIIICVMIYFLTLLVVHPERNKFVDLVKRIIKNRNV